MYALALVSVFVAEFAMEVVRVLMVLLVAADRFPFQAVVAALTVVKEGCRECTFAI